MTIAYYSFFLQLLLFFFASFSEANGQRKVYLVHMKVGGHRYESSVGHQELLGEVLDDDSTVANAHIYTYSESFTGFSARLTESERQKLMNRREVLDVTRSKDLKLHTTRSWDFMNLTLKAERRPEVESNLVVAVIDSGIWPDSTLFSSDGPPPSGWENKCENITCNSKIVGARSYYPDKDDGYIVIEEKSVIDVMGHGTHTASIVAGSVIHDASYFELAKGTMRGGVPSAKIAVYKTCWRIKDKDNKNSSVCPEHSVLMAIEDAIKDNVSIISYSQGSDEPIPMQENCISWAFLRAFNNGILTSASAGNSGDYYSVINGAPWIMTVAASLKDTHFETNLSLKLRNNKERNITAYNTINTFDTQSSYYPLVKESLPSKSTRKRDLLVTAEIKDEPILSNLKNDKGKDVCFNQSEITLLDKAIKEEAEGAIILGKTNDSLTAEPYQYPIASIYLDKVNGKTLRKYLAIYKSKGLAKIHKTMDNLPFEEWVPTVADLSSRGPNCDNYLANILKPDIAAPGLNIIAGWPEDVKLVEDVTVKDNRRSKYNIMSGTSMACPHATGLALYLKSFNDTWSPSAIKSALMTTSTKIVADGDEFAYGSGQLNATNILDPGPGLIYETHYQDYIDFMCKQGYNTDKLRSHLGNPNIDCSKTKIDHDADLNYPSMMARVELNKEFKKVFHRNVTNVGPPSSTYLGEINNQSVKNYDTQIFVDPRQLHFSKHGETKTFTVTVTGESEPNWDSGKTFTTGNTWLTWTEINGPRQVRSPIVIYSMPKRTNARSEVSKN